MVQLTRMNIAVFVIIPGYVGLPIGNAQSTWLSLLVVNLHCLYTPFGMAVCRLVFGKIVFTPK